MDINIIPGNTRKEKLALLKKEENAIIRKRIKQANINQVIAVIAASDDDKTRFNYILECRTVLGSEAAFKFFPVIPRLIKLDVSAKEARKAGANISMVGNDAKLISCFGLSHGKHYAAHYIWKKGGGLVDAKYLPSVAKDGRATYVRARHINYVRSWAWIKNPSTVVVVLHDTITDITLPQNHSWETDVNGLLVRCPDGMDYHPQPADLRRKYFLRELPAILAAQQKARERSRMLGVGLSIEDMAVNTRVQLADSIYAGNCVAGSLRFAERKFGLSREEVLAAGPLLGIAAASLLQAANGENHYVEAAIRAAWRRETLVSI